MNNNKSKNKIIFIETKLFFLNLRHNTQQAETRIRPSR